MKKIRKLFGITLFVILFLYCSIVIVQKVFWKDKTPSIFGVKNFIVLSGSMSPTIETGDIVLVKENLDIKKKDIVAFKVDGAIVTHRVVDIIEKDNKVYYQTKGDANKTPDFDLIKYEDIEGRYIFKIGAVGKIVLFLHTGYGMAFFLISFVIYLILGYFTDSKNRFQFRKWEEIE